MSIYSSSYRATRILENDVYARPTPASKQVVRRDALAQRAPRGDEHTRRKGQPANVLLRPTLEWVASLPPSVKPTMLLGQYARIANIIAANWDDPEAFAAYMDSLCRDDRGHRKGFPPGVLRELLALRKHGAVLSPQGASRWAALQPG